MLVIMFFWQKDGKKILQTFAKMLVIINFDDVEKGVSKSVQSDIGLIL